VPTLKLVTVLFSVHNQPSSRSHCTLGTVSQKNTKGISGVSLSGRCISCHSSISIRSHWLLHCPCIL